MSSKKIQYTKPRAIVPKPKKTQAEENAFEIAEMLPATKSFNSVFSNLGYWKFCFEHHQTEYAANKYNKQIEFANELIKFLEEQKATYEDFKKSAYYPYQKKEEIQESQKE